MSVARTPDDRSDNLIGFQGKSDNWMVNSSEDKAEAARIARFIAIIIIIIVIIVIIIIIIINIIIITARIAVL